MIGPLLGRSIEPAMRKGLQFLNCILYVCLSSSRFFSIHDYISSSSPGLKSFVGKDLNLIVMAWCETCGPWEGGRLVALGMMVGDLWALESGVLGDLWALESGVVGDLWTRIPI